MSELYFPEMLSICYSKQNGDRQGKLFLWAPLWPQQLCGSSCSFDKGHRAIQATSHDNPNCCSASESPNSVHHYCLLKFTYRNILKPKKRRHPIGPKYHCFVSRSILASPFYRLWALDQLSSLLEVVYQFTKWRKWLQNTTWMTKIRTPDNLVLISPGWQHVLYSQII